MNLSKLTDIAVKIDLSQQRTIHDDSESLVAKFRKIVSDLNDAAWNGFKTKATLIIEDPNSNLYIKIPVFPCKVGPLESDAQHQQVHTEWVARGDIRMEGGDFK